MRRNFEINESKAFIIAEVAQSHDGSLGMAHAFVDAAAEAGVDAIKFQTHLAAAESTLDEPFRVNFSRQDATRYAYWKRMEFSNNQWAELAEHAKERRLHFLSSPFSPEAVELLKKLHVPAWKIGSGEAVSMDLLEAVLNAGGPVLISTGMSRWEEIDSVVKYLRTRSAEFVLLQCTSKYPTPLEETGLNVLSEMKERYDCPVGLSDHSGTPWPALAAMARGAAVVEIHVTFDRRMFGPDVPASITFSELELLCAARDAFFIMDEHPVSKNKMAEDLRAMRTTFGKSITLRRSMSRGQVITRDDLASKKPGNGIPPAEMAQVIGRRLARDVGPDRLLRWEDLDEQA